MMDEITTTDMAKFGSRERHMAAELLTASCAQGFPSDFEDDALKQARAEIAKVKEVCS